MEKKWDVLGFGAIAVDDLFYVDHYPQIDEKIPIIKKWRQGGGNTATALVAVARLGSKAAFCGVLGYDELSVFSIEELSREGVDTSMIIRKNGARPFAAVVIVDTTQGKRSILFSSEGVRQPEADDVNELLVGQSRVLFIDHQAVTIGLHAVKLAKKLNIPVVGDFEGKIFPELKELVGLVDHLIIGIDFAQQLVGTGDIQTMFRSLAGPDRACCVITAGEQGCWYSERGQPIHNEPAMKIRVVDTTGCGDVFHGAYASAISHGETISHAVKFATIAAGLKATQPGGRIGIPDYQSVISYIQ
jgi:sugar/nucleoside kinase (ribokinase family)